MEIKIGKMDMNTAWEIPWKCWEMMKANYPLALGLGLIQIAGLALTMIPGLGAVLSHIYLFAFSIAILFVARDWEEGKPSSIFHFLNHLIDFNKYKPIIPILIASVAFTTLENVLVPDGTSVFILYPSVALTIAIGFVISLMTIQIIFNPEITIQKSFENTLNTIGANIAPIFVTWVFYWVIMAMCAALLLLPLFFAFIPAALSFNYVFYRVLLEGLELESDPKESEPLL